MRWRNTRRGRESIGRGGKSRGTKKIRRRIGRKILKARGRKREGEKKREREREREKMRLTRVQTYARYCTCACARRTKLVSDELLHVNAELDASIQETTRYTAKNQRETCVHTRARTCDHRANRRWRVRAVVNIWRDILPLSHPSFSLPLDVIAIFHVGVREHVFPRLVSDRCQPASSSNWLFTVPSCGKIQWDSFFSVLSLDTR